MSQAIDERIRWTSADLELLPDNRNHYEIIDGELFVRYYSPKLPNCCKSRN
ncbi:MAG: hypothetical protein V7K33_24805 [Nostoc sp.]